MYKIKIILLFAVAMILLSSCDRDNIVNTGKNQNSTTGTIENESDLIQSYLNTPDLVGVIECRSEKRNDYTINWKNFGSITEYKPYDGIDNYAEATFRDATNKPITVENLLVNASLLKEYSKGAYSKVGPDKLELYFGVGNNKYYIECLNNSLLPDSTFGQVSFSNRIEITNIHRDDTLSRQNGIPVEWIGGYSNGYVKVEIRHTNPEEGAIGQTVGSYVMTTNTGAYTIDSLRLSLLSLVNIYYDITVTSYEPVIQTLSNGKKIILLGVSEYNTTIFLVD